MHTLKLFIFSLFLFLHLAGKGQVTITKKDLEGPKEGAGISSICFNNGVFYLPSERQKIIFCFDNLFNPLPTLTLKTDDTVEIEGCAFFNGQLYLLSENKAILYRRNNDGTLETVLSDLPKAENNKGMEGLTTNGTDKFYLLLEQKKVQNNCYAIIYTYEVNKSGKGSFLTEIDTTMIILPSKSYRYADILYETTSNSLLLLRSKKKDYAVEQVPLNKEGLPVITGPGRRKILHRELTATANEYNNRSPKEKYDNNLEGLTIRNGILYIVSDNCEGVPVSCETYYKTLLLAVHGLIFAQ